MFKLWLITVAGSALYNVATHSQVVEFDSKEQAEAAIAAINTNKDRVSERVIRLY